MSWRTVVISNRCKLDLKMGYMVVRGEETQRVFLDEIAVLMIENTAVSLTGCLLAALTEKKIKVVFCDEKRNPSSELVPFAGCHDSTGKIRAQIGWSEDIKKEIWTEIVREKILKQAQLLESLEKQEFSQLMEYRSSVRYGDETNREGHAAKVYFHSLFGIDFSRGDGGNIINAALNYGYSLILSLVNREISANGYLLQLGIFHDNMFNPFNLSCDLMEPLRIIVDQMVYDMEFTCFETEQKHSMMRILSKEVRINEKNQILPNGVRIYVKSVFNALNDADISLLQFPDYEL